MCRSLKTSIFRITPMGGFNIMDEGGRIVRGDGSGYDYVFSFGYKKEAAHAPEDQDWPDGVVRIDIEETGNDSVYIVHFIGNEGYRPEAVGPEIFSRFGFDW